MLNSVIVQGRLTSDVKVIDTKEGKKIGLFSIANNKDKETTYFFQCKSFSDKVFPYLKKGTQILVSGELVQNKYNDKEGNPKENIGILAYKIDFVSSGEKKKEEPKEVSDEDIPF